MLIPQPEIAEYIPAYNLLIHLIRSSPELPSLLPTILQNLSTPPPTSPHNGPALSIHALSTIFNVLPANSPLRYPVLRTTLGVVAEYGMYETLAPQLKNVEKWIGEWQSSAEETRDLYLMIAGIAEKSKDDEYARLLPDFLSLPHRYQNSQANIRIVNSTSSSSGPSILSPQKKPATLKLASLLFVSSRLLLTSRRASSLTILSHSMPSKS